MTPSELESLKTKFKVLGIVELEVSSLDEGTRHHLKVVLYPSMFSSGLKLPFFHPFRDVMDFMSLAHA